MVPHGAAPRFNSHEQDGSYNQFQLRNHNSHHLASSFPVTSNHLNGNNMVNLNTTKLNLPNRNNMNNVPKKPANRGSLSKQFESIQQQQNHQFLGHNTDAANGNPNHYQQSMMSGSLPNSNMR
jgi:hypothetical protein